MGAGVQWLTVDVSAAYTCNIEFRYNMHVSTPSHAQLRVHDRAVTIGEYALCTAAALRCAPFSTAKIDGLQLTIQGDTSGCDEPPVDFKTKVSL